jgi:predicted TPR repeat methyltransferase
MTYDEDYFKSHLGPIPCTWDSPEWNAFFANIAREIVDKYKPVTVIDAGCGIGLLVKHLLDYDHVNTMGFDSSTYAIDVAHLNGLLHHCAPCALEFADDIKWSADVVTCIEVVEHIDECMADQCIKNLCSMSTKYVIFSSSPDDHLEETHVNVQPELYWTKLFNKYGFKKVDTATYISPQAIVLSNVSNN